MAWPVRKPSGSSQDLKDLPSSSLTMWCVLANVEQSSLLERIMYVSAHTYVINFTDSRYFKQLANDKM